MSLTSVIFDRPCHFGDSLGFLPSRAKSLYHTKSSVLNECGFALLSKFALTLLVLEVEMFLAINCNFCQSR